jgi:ADP-ribose pyrophosphatase
MAGQPDGARSSAKYRRSWRTGGESLYTDGKKGWHGVMMKSVYRGRVVNLNLETVTLPNGVTVEMEVIHHSGAAAVVPMKDENTVLLVRQYRHAVGGYILEIPAGKLHPNEDPRDCAARELEEEIGFRASALEPVITFFTTPGFTDEVIHIFRATALTPGTQNLGHDEVLEVIELPLEMAIGQIEDGTIRDAKTIVGLQAVYLRNRRR